MGEVWHAEHIEGPSGYFMRCQLCGHELLAGEMANVRNDVWGEVTEARCQDHASPVDAARAVLLDCVKSGTRYVVTFQGVPGYEGHSVGYIETWDDNVNCEFVVRTNPKNKLRNGVGLNPDSLIRIAHARKSKGGVIWDALVPTMAEEVAVIQGLQRLLAGLSA